MGLDNPLHIAFLLVAVLLVFGAKRLPEIGRSLGGGMRGFKDAITGEDGAPADAARGPHAAQPVLAAAQPAPAPAAAVVASTATAETQGAPAAGAGLVA